MARLTHRGKSYRIAIALRYNQPDNRARISGALRFLGTRPDVETRVIDSSSPNFLTDCRRLTSGWIADGFVFSYLEDIKPLLRTSTTGRPMLAMLDGPRSFRKANVDIRMDTRNLTDGLADLLLRRGYVNYAFCGTDVPIEQFYSQEIESSFRASLPKRFPLASFHENPAVSFSINLAQAASWVQTLPKPCAAMCYSDEVARNLLNACNIAHIAVPEQIAVVGLGNTAEVCETTRPTLTSVLPDFEQSGYNAAELLYQCLTSRKAKGPLVRTYGLRKIVERSSTTDLRGCGRLVSAAEELMRMTPLRELSADFLSNQLNVSRRLLEMHFKTVIGRGVHAEIIRLRLEAIRERLCSTSDPIGPIVESCGFKSYTAAQIAFRKRFSISMSRFRNHPDP